MTTILVVDDAESNAKLLKNALEVEGYDILLAYNGQDGLNTAVAHIPDAIILDLRLPETMLDGWQVIERIRANSHTAHIPIIITSVEISKDDKARAMALGANVYFAKPFRIAEVKHAITYLLNDDPN